MPFSIAGATVKLVGAKEAQELLKELGNASSRNQSATLLTVGEAIVDQMQSNCPVDTGFMSDNIGVAESSENSVTVESSAAYSGFVNYGTIHQSPQPFFSDVAENLDSYGLTDTIVDDVFTNWEDVVARHRPAGY